MMLGKSPALVRAAFDRLPKDKWDVRMDPKRFTPREAMAHLRHWEPVCRERMRIALLASGSPVANWDEDRHCKEHGYAESDPHQMMDEWMAERETTLKWLKSCPKPFLSKTVIHRVNGELSIDQLASALLAHDMYHLDHLETVKNFSG